MIAWLDSFATDAGCCWCEHLESIKLPQKVQDEIPSAYVSLCNLFHSKLIEARDQKLMTYPLNNLWRPCNNNRKEDLVGKEKKKTRRSAFIWGTLEKPPILASRNIKVIDATMRLHNYVVTYRMQHQAV